MLQTIPFRFLDNMLTGYAHSVSEDLIDTVNATADYGNNAAQKRKASHEMRHAIRSKLNP
jgi:hypothetical protein